MMIDRQLFPEAARFCYVRTQPLEDDTVNYESLHPLEQRLASTAVDRRKSEFGDARWCAHQALREAGYTGDEPILRGTGGMPLWPAGFTGSLSHTAGLRAAVVAPTTALWSMGLDVEIAEPLPEGVLSMIARSGELAQLKRLADQGIDCADRLLFCAKEATYKAWYPLAHRWLDFDEAHIDLRDDGTVVVYLLARPAPVPIIEGRWVVRDGYAMVSTMVPAARNRTRQPWSLPG